MKRAYGVLVGVALLAPSVGWGQESGIVCRQRGSTNLGMGIASIAPLASVIVSGAGGSAALDASQCVVSDGKLLHFSFSFFSPWGTGEVSAEMDPDPFISFGTTTTNIGPGPVTYAFLFGVPIVPGLYSAATSTGGVTVTNGVSGTATVATSAVYPTYISGYGTVGAVPTNLGVDLGTNPCTAGPGVPLTVTNTCNQGTVANTFAPTFYDNLEALVTYTQTDVASVASWSGAVTLSAVPEPASLALLATGAVVMGAGAVVRRRRG